MSNNKMIEINCDIVCDLLPLYHDGVVSDTTKQVVEEHLGDCSSCKQEYEELLLELPIEASENNTKNKFKVMMSKQKFRRIAILITSIVLSCVLVVSIIFGLTEIPLVNVPDQEIKIHRVYGYETEDGYEFFVLYNTSVYNKMSFELGEYKNGVQSLEIKKPIISDKLDFRDEIWTFSNKTLNENGEKLDSLSFGGDIIWTKDEANKEIPEYVFEYTSAKDGEWITGDYDVNKDYFRISYEDDSYKQWTIDGELVEQSK